MELKKGLIPGVAAGVAFTIVSFVSWMIPITGEWYSKTFPWMVSPEAAWTMTLSVFVTGLFMGLVYSVVNSAVPGTGIRKGINYGIMIWLLSLMWPIMMMGLAPVNVWIIDLISGLISYSIAGAVIAVTYKV